MHAENVDANTKYNPNYIHTTIQNEFLIKYHSHSFSETINIIYFCIKFGVVLSYNCFTGCIAMANLKIVFSYHFLFGFNM